MNLAPIDQLWLLACSALVLLMQAGFLCLEAGLTRSKNAVNVAVKNLVDLAITPLMFWGLGAGLMFGVSWGGWVGVPGSLSDQVDSSLLTFLLFQMLFCATASTIVSGAVAERMRFSAYWITCVVVGGLIYPLIGHWTWGGALSGAPGWLQALGFVDFAGSGVVHMTGGFAALAGAIAVGPRYGRFDDRHRATGFPKSSLPTAMLGALMLSVGWIGFNGGSTLRLNDAVPLIVVNTVLAGAAGAAAALLVGRWSRGVLAPDVVINGLLGGLVAVCALADVAKPAEAALLGGLAGVTSYLATLALVRRRIDDAVGAFPVHGACGALGLIAQPLASGARSGDQTLWALGVQALGAVVIGVVAFGPIYVLIRYLLPVSLRRVTAEEERLGLNLSEHGVESELHVLLRSITAEDPSESDGLILADHDESTGLASAVQQRVRAAYEQGEAITRSEARLLRTEALHDYGRFLHAILDGLESAVCILDEECRIVETNRAWDRFAHDAGVAAQTALGASFLTFCRRERVYLEDAGVELPDAAEAIIRGDAADFTGEYPARVDDATRVLRVQLKPLPSHEQGKIIVLQKDVTEERRAERRLTEQKQRAETLAGALEASQASLELAIGAAELGLWHWDIETGYFELGYEWVDRVFENQDQFLASVESFRSRLHEDELVLWTPDDAASLAPEEPYDRQFRLRFADGRHRWVHALGRATAHDEHGVPISLSGILIDIHEQKDRTIRDAGMAKIIEDSINEVYVVDRETDRFLEVNRGARENLGYSLDELREMKPTDLKVDMNLEERLEVLEPLLTGEQDRIEVETVNKRRDGSTYPLMLTLQKARLVGRDVLVAIGVDLTQRRELEAQLADAQRLEAIGQLSAGVAHEMNTPLQFVGNNIQFLSECSTALFQVIDAFQAAMDSEGSAAPWRDREETLHEVLGRTRFERVRQEAPKAIDDCKEGIDRVLEIVRAMKEFSHPGDRGKTPSDLNRALQSTATVTRNRWKSVADLELELDPNLPAVVCEGNSINQVFVNLIVNAADAVADRREIDPDAPAGRIVVRSRADGDQAVFEVEDNGNGMPEDVQRRVFEPFFTTKEVGKGTGQGLSLSHTIVVQKHGGSMHVESVIGQGTTMRIALPVRPPTSDKSSAPPREVPHEVVES